MIHELRPERRASWSSWRLEREQSRVTAAAGGADKFLNVVLVAAACVVPQSCTSRGRGSCLKKSSRQVEVPYCVVLELVGIRYTVYRCLRVLQVACMILSAALILYSLYPVPARSPQSSLSLAHSRSPPLACCPSCPCGARATR